MPDKAPTRQPAAAPPDAAANPLAPVARGRFWPTAAVLLLALVTAAATLTFVWNFDIFWHLASGEWMLRHGRVLDFDPFGIPEDSSGPSRWVNVHWVFQLMVAWLYSAGGFGLLSAIKCVLATAAVAVFAWAFRRRVPPAWLMLCGLAMLLVMLERVRVRPEAFTLLFLTITLVLLEQVRQGASPRRLWWLALLMLVWVNMHGVFIVGLGVLWLAVGGSFVERWRGRERSGLASQGAVLPALAATLACFVTPWPLEAAMQPLLLWTRISGQMEAYTYGVSELARTYTVLELHLPALLVAALTALVMLLSYRQTPLWHWVLLVAFAALGAMARRNTGLLGPVCGILLAVHGGTLLNRGAIRFPHLSRLGPVLAGAMALVLLAGAAGFATEYIWAQTRQPMRFGPGLLAKNYPLAAARWLDRLPVGGDVMVENFGDAGPFLHTFAHNRAQPTRRVFMDPRLEAHSLQRFVQQFQTHLDLGHSPASAAAVRFHDDVRFIVVNSKSYEQLSAMNRCGRFTLAYLDPVAAVFARNDWRGGTGAESLPALNVADLDVPLDRDGFLRGLPRPLPRWWRQNFDATHFATGSLLLPLGEQAPSDRGQDVTKERLTLLSLRYLQAACREGSTMIGAVQGTLAQACLLRSLQCDAPTDALPVDLYSARALALYNTMDWEKVDPADRPMFHLQQVRAMLQARQLDTARAAMNKAMESLPPNQKANPPAAYTELLSLINEQMKRSTLLLVERKVSTLPLHERVAALTAPDMGLIDRAIATLEDKPVADYLLLGDLYLRKGNIAKARGLYNRVSPDLNPASGFRVAMCDWAEGKLFDARERMNAILGRFSRLPPAPYYYGYALLLEEIGDYPEALIFASRTDDPKLAEMFARLKKRLDAVNR